MKKKKKGSRLLPWQRKTSLERHLVYASLVICDDYEVEVAKFYTSILSCWPGESLFFGEDFLFDRVNSTLNAVITLYCITLGENGNPSTIPVDDCGGQRCLGKARIPLSRLEENRTVVQWYQLVDETSKDGLRTSLKVKVTFAADPLVNVLGTTTKNRRASSLAVMVEELQHSKTLSSPLAATVSTFGEFPQTTAAATDNKGNGLVISKPSCGVEKESSDLSLQTAESHFSQIEKVADGQSSSTSLGGPRWKSIASMSSPGTADGGTLGSVHSFRHHVLPCGVIDYSIILGPSSLDNLLPSHCITSNGQCQRIRPSSMELYGSSPVTHQSNVSSPLDPPHSASTGLFSTDSSSSSGYKCFVGEDIVLWDRLPATDWPGFDLPSKIEWFACPEGSVTIVSPTRPAPYTLSFMLNAGMDSQDVTG
eukprot:scaffold3243_cov173-Ochromonas_danica.AAC.1